MRGSDTPAVSPIATGPTLQTGVRNVSSRRIRWRITTRVDRPSLMRFIRYLTATSTLVLTAFLTLVLAYYSLSVALGADEFQQAIVRGRIAHARRGLLQTGAPMELPTPAAVRSPDLGLCQGQALLGSAKNSTSLDRRGPL